MADLRLRKKLVKELTPELEERRQDLTHRRLAHYKLSDDHDVLVMLDPKIYLRDEDADGNKAIDNFTDVCKFLREIQPSKDVRLLPCLNQGWYEADTQQRLYLVFRLPPTIAPVHTIYSLHDYLSETFRPSLTERLALAKSLAKTVLYMHDQGYHHKGIQSESIVFFRKEAQPRTLSEPFLVGLDFSRKVDGRFWSEKPYETRTCSYLHPSLLQDPNRDYVPKYDFYALGVLFVELALFQRIEKMLDKYLDMQKKVMMKAQALKIRGILLGESAEPDEDFLREMAFHAGDPFAEITKVCLVGDFGRSHDREKQVRIFRERVVNELENYTI